MKPQNSIKIGNSPPPPTPPQKKKSQFDSSLKTILLCISGIVHCNDKDLFHFS